MTKLEDAIARAEAQYGPIMPTRRALAFVGGRSTLNRAEHLGQVKPLGRRGGVGEKTYLTADLVRWMAGAVAMPARAESPRRAERAVGDALDELASIRGAK